VIVASSSTPSPRHTTHHTQEKNVLVTAVRAHVEDRIIVYESKCVVFGE